MYHKQPMGNRICAMVLVLLLLVGMIPTSVFAVETEKTTDNAALVADTYKDSLTSEEQAILNSGALVVKKTHTYAAPNGEDGLITVDPVTRTITAAVYEDNGYTWTPVAAKVVYQGGEEAVALDSNHKGTFAYEGNGYTIEVDYTMYITVDAAEQLSLLNAPHNLAVGLGNLETLKSLGSFLTLFAENVGLLYDNLVVGFVANGVTIQMADGDAKDAIIALRNQTLMNTGNVFDLSKNVTAYQDAEQKLAYLKDSGAATKEVTAKTYGYMKDIYAAWESNDGAIRTLYNNFDMLVTLKLMTQEEADAKKGMMKTAMDLLSDNLVVLQPVAEDPWTVLDGEWPIQTGANLDSKVLAAIGKTAAHTAEEITSESLLADARTIKANVDRYDVTVAVQAYVVEGTNSATLTMHEYSEKETLTLAKGTSLADVAAAITIGDAAFEALATAYGIDKEHYDVKIVETVGTELTADATYTIQYVPKEYKVTTNFTEPAEQNLPYGYKMTLPENAEEGKVYDYDVNGKAYLQGEIVFIAGETTITRTVGKEWSFFTLKELAAANETNASAVAVLESTALISNDRVHVRYPDDDIVETEPNKITAPDFYSGISGLYWVATEGTVILPGGGTDTVTFTDGVATYAGNFDSVNVTYTLNVTDLADAEKMLVTLNLPHVLHAEYKAQKDEMDALANNSDLMSGLEQLNNNLATIDSLKNSFGEAAQAAITSIMENCLENGQLKLYTALAAYKESGMTYFYQSHNYEDLVKQISLMQANMGPILDDAKLTELLNLNNMGHLIDRLAKVREVIENADLTDNAPNAAINRNAGVDEIAKLVAAIAAAADAPAYTTLPTLTLKTVRTAAGAGRVTVTVTVTQFTADGQVMYTKSDSTTSFALAEGSNSYTLTPDDIAALQAKLNALKPADLDEDIYYVSSNDLPAAGEVLTGNAHYTVTWSPKKLTVSFTGIPGAEDLTQEIYASVRTIDLPYSTTPGIRYDITIGTKVVTASAEAHSYTFTKDELSLFVDGKLTLTVKEVNEGREKIMNLIDAMNQGLYDNGVTDGSTLNVGFIPVEDADGNISIVLRVNSLTGVPMQGLMMGIAEPIGMSGMTVYLDNKPFYEGGIYLQTIIDAIVNSGTGMDAIMATVDKDGNLVHLQLDGAVADIDTLGLLGNTDLYGAEIMQSTLTLNGVDTKFYVTMNDTASLRNAISKIQNNLNINTVGGKLDLSATLPDKAYQAYLAAGMITGNVELTNINDGEIKNSVEYLWNLIKPILDDEGLSLGTVDNTMGKLNQTTNIAGNATYNNLFNYFMKAYKQMTFTYTESNGAYYSFNASLDDVAGLIAALNLPAIAAEMIKDESLVLPVNISITNAETTKYEAGVVDINAAGIANKIGFVTNLADAIAKANDGTLIILTDNYDGSIITEKNIYLDLCGWTVNGDIIGSNIKIIDSSLGNTGKATGTVDAYADYTTNTLYSVAEENGNISITLNADMLVDPQRPSVRSIAFSLAFDLLINYYTSASLNLNGNDIYAVEIADVLAMIETVNGDDVNAVLDMIDCAGLSAFVNTLIADLTDFNAMAEAVANGDALATYTIETKCWDIDIKRIADGDYLTVGILPSEDKGQNQSVSLYLQGSTQEANDAASELLEAIGAIVTVDATVDLTDLHYASSTITASADANADIVVDMTANPNYAVVLGILLADTSDSLKAQIVPVLENFLAGNGNISALKPYVESAKVSELVAAVKNLNMHSDFVAMVEGLGLNVDSTEADELYETYRVLFAAVGYVLRYMDITGGNQTLAGVETEFGVYGGDKEFVNSSVAVRGYTAKLDGTVSASLYVKLFSDGDIRVNDADGKILYVGDSLAEAFEVAVDGSTITILNSNGVTLDSTVYVHGSITVVNADRVTMTDNASVVLMNLGDKLTLDYDWNNVVNQGILRKLVKLVEGGKYIYYIAPYDIYVSNYEGNIYAGDSLYDAFKSVKGYDDVHISINNENGVKLDGNVTVYGTVTVRNAGLVDLGEYTVTLDSADDKLILDAEWSTDNVVCGLANYELTLTVDGTSYIYTLTEIPAPPVADITVTYVENGETKVLEFTAAELNAALTEANKHSGSVVKLNVNAALTADVTITTDITVEGAAKISQNGKSLNLTGKGKITADAALTVTTTETYYKVTVTTNGSWTIYALAAKDPSYAPTKPGYGLTVTKSDSIVGYKVEKNIVLLDVRVTGITVDQLKAALNLPAIDANKSTITAVVDINGKALSGSNLVKNGSKVTFTATNPASSTPAVYEFYIVIMGDVNCNGTTDSGDATMMRMHYQNLDAIGEKTDSAFQVELKVMAADMNQNGRLDSGDATMNRNKYQAWDTYESALN